MRRLRHMRSRWKLRTTGVAVLAGVAFAAFSLNPAQAVRPTTGVGSCTLKGWNPKTDPEDAKNLPLGQRPQSYKPDDIDCTGAVFAPFGAEFAKFPQPKNFAITDK